MQDVIHAVLSVCLSLSLSLSPPICLCVLVYKKNEKIMQQSVTNKIQLKREIQSQRRIHGVCVSVDFTLHWKLSLTFINVFSSYNRKDPPSM